MGQISNRFFVTSIKDGTVLTAAMYSDKTLTQAVTTETKASVPDWTVAANQPTVRCVVRTGATVKTPTVWEWYLNDVQITFESKTVGTNSSNFGGIFQWATVTVDGVSCPAVKIRGNIITQVNQDNDVLSCRGTTEYNGANIEYNVSTTIRMTTLNGSGYYGWIEGDSYVTAQSGAAGTATMQAHLATKEGDVQAFKTRWSLEVDTQPAGWPKVVSASNYTAQTTITGSEFVDWAVIKVEFFAADDTDMTDSTRISTAYWDVDDMEDEEEMYICSYVINNVKGGLDVSLRESQTAQMVVWIGKRGDQTQIDARYTSFKCRVLDSEGNTITNFTGSNVTTGSGSLVVTDGYLNITKADGITTPVTAAKAGVITIPATFADTKGGRLTGIVVATSAS